MSRPVDHRVPVTCRVVLAVTLVGLGLGVGPVGLGADPVAAQARPAGCPEPTARLRDEAERVGVDVGVAYRPAHAAADPCYATVAAEQFTSLTPEIATFPNAVAPTPDGYRFDDVDAVCAAAAAADQTCSAHATVWDPVDHPEWGIVPEWIRVLDPQGRRRVMTDMITAVGRHLGDRLTHWTVANEVVRSDGDLWANVWRTTDDDAYLFDAYRAARRAAPEAELLYNDFGAEDLNAKSDAVFDLARRLHAETVEVEIDGERTHRPLLDGVGLQMHIGVAPGLAPEMADVAANLARLREAGLTVRITELDVRVPTADGTVSSADADRQAELFGAVAATCLADAGCRGISLWGHSDAHSWITDNPATFDGEGSAHPLDVSYRSKPAFDALVAAFRDAPTAAEPDSAGAAPLAPPAPPAETAASTGRRRSWPLAGAVAGVVLGCGVVVVAFLRRRPTAP